MRPVWDCSFQIWHHGHSADQSLVVGHSTKGQVELLEHLPQGCCCRTKPGYHSCHLDHSTVVDAEDVVAVVVEVVERFVVVVVSWPVDLEQS